MDKKERILSVRNMEVKFQVRGRFLTAIRNVDLDVYDQEILAIVGESGSGKSVVTKTFTGMIESNGWISNGSIVYRPRLDDEKSHFKKPVDVVNLQSPLISKEVIKSVIKIGKKNIGNCYKKISKLYDLMPTFSNKKAFEVEKKIIQLEKVFNSENNQNFKEVLKNKIEELKLELKTFEELESIKSNKKTDIINKLNNALTKANSSSENINQNLFTKKNKNTKISNNLENIKSLLNKVNNSSLIKNEINELYEEIIINEININKIKPLSILQKKDVSKIINIIKLYNENPDIGEENKNFLISYFTSNISLNRIQQEFRDICKEIVAGNNIDKDHFDNILFDWDKIKNVSIINKIKAIKEVRNLRGKTIATIFQDPMTSLNPLLSVGFQISEVLRKQQGLSKREAKKEAINLLEQVGIPDANKRYKDIPGKYSGGMRQRVVIAIALACKPKVLICDEPTTALDVTIQAQILELIKELQKLYKFTVIFITHDLGVVAKIADRVAVMYAGQIVEVGTVKDIFNNSAHPYTWALLSSLPQLGKKGEELFSIEGTPPSLFNVIKGDAFAPRNKYALEIDYIKEPPMFKISDTHFAKTWLLDKRSPKIEKPEVLKNLKSRIKEVEKVG
ncbi:oligopeptide ABC transporter ATP-binding protein [Spiroplasma litorale]|uniref:Oligopeptide ABC transporter ATP-binding protein n=1 Tax=Spiroplasma litorale TaxID=216942 RepID=A0A0K1W0R2_9MOLU|nr:oligopeptide/dipeptide ABC transporter ATP-binding protein [Spiroplasma litorale]AKX33909.1 oligopeptide ABC transporter ATP-binding protein [Spiroplasma litorale]